MAGTSNRGFASMDANKQREIASKGGRAAHQKGTAHQWSSDEARAAGRKGGVSRSNNLNARAQSRQTSSEDYAVHTAPASITIASNTPQYSEGRS